MADATFELVGADRLKRYFAELPEKMIEKVMRSALYAGAGVIRDDERSRAPILDLEKWGGPHEPGLLLQSIRITTGRRGDVIRGKVGITPEAFYGHFIEYGTRHAAAHPFARPAADHASQGAASKIIEVATERAARELGAA